ncbi:C2H2-type zinc finger protein [Allofrancisella inopinata]|uniref:C2H2-type zinc finger protein n=1 Tax=Allofrancisella inopinata TaxID=1085647 RepID=UPI0010627E53|nr:C2H2-type zinc finger protein [Allofrancisella inopinata]TDT67385.1 C2H2-type zinc finger protein [Allofrancisella inopinata]
MLYNLYAPEGFKDFLNTIAADIYVIPWSEKLVSVVYESTGFKIAFGYIQYTYLKFGSKKPTVISEEYAEATKNQLLQDNKYIIPKLSVDACKQQLQPEELVTLIDNPKDNLLRPFLPDIGGGALLLVCKVTKLILAVLVYDTPIDHGLHCYYNWDNSGNNKPKHPKQNFVHISYLYSSNAVYKEKQEFEGKKSGFFANGYARVLLSVFCYNYKTELESTDKALGYYGSMFNNPNKYSQNPRAKSGLTIIEYNHNDGKEIFDNLFKTFWDKQDFDELVKFIKQLHLMTLKINNQNPLDKARSLREDLLTAQELNFLLSKNIINRSSPYFKKKIKNITNYISKIIIISRIVRSKFNGENKLKFSKDILPEIDKFYNFKQTQVFSDRSNINLSKEVIDLLIKALQYEPPSKTPRRPPDNQWYKISNYKDVESDGNCFYRAVLRAARDNNSAHLLPINRASDEAIIQAMRYDLLQVFDSYNFQQALRNSGYNAGNLANIRSSLIQMGNWNNSAGDLAPQLLSLAYPGLSINIVSTYVGGNNMQTVGNGHNIITLGYTGDHYFAGQIKDNNNQIVSTVNTSPKSNLSASISKKSTLSTKNLLPQTSSNMIGQKRKDCSTSLEALEKEFNIDNQSSLYKQEQTDIKVKNHKCDFAGCNKGFFSRSNLRRHQQTHAETRERLFVCKHEGCNKGFFSRSDLQKHQQTHAETRERLFVCKHEGCNKGFFSRSNLLRHQQTHTGEKPFVCKHESCNRSFSRQENLKAHLQTHAETREKLKPFVCKHEGCNKSFNRQGNLKAHMQTHGEEKIFVCEVCGQAFKQNSGLIQHKKNHQ